MRLNPKRAPAIYLFSTPNEYTRMATVRDISILNPRRGAEPLVLFVTIRLEELHLNIILMGQANIELYRSHKHERYY